MRAHAYRRGRAREFFTHSCSREVRTPSRPDDAVRHAAACRPLAALNTNTDTHFLMAKSLQSKIPASSFLQIACIQESEHPYPYVHPHCSHLFIVNFQTVCIQGRQLLSGSRVRLWNKSGCSCPVAFSPVRCSVLHTFSEDRAGYPWGNQWRPMENYHSLATNITLDNPMSITVAPHNP